jgi:hypothetical protein
MSFIINPYSFSSAFNPLSLSPSLWLSDTGSDTATWPDLSGNSRDATQATSGQRPAIITNAQNGRQVRRFDGTNDSLDITTGLGMFRNIAGSTIIVVYKWISNPTTSKAVFFASTGSSATTSRVFVGGGISSRKLSAAGRRLDADGSLSCNSSSDNTNSFFIQSAVFDYVNTDLLQYINGTLDGSNTSFQASGNTSNTDSLGMRIGSASTDTQFCANVDIAEILVFPTALSTTNRQAVEAYLRDKWATP